MNTQYHCTNNLGIVTWQKCDLMTQSAILQHSHWCHIWVQLQALTAKSQQALCNHNGSSESCDERHLFRSYWGWGVCKSRWGRHTLGGCVSDVKVQAIFNLASARLSTEILDSASDDQGESAHFAASTRTSSSWATALFAELFTMLLLARTWCRYESVLHACITMCNISHVPVMLLSWECLYSGIEHSALSISFYVLLFAPIGHIPTPLNNIHMTSLLLLLMPALYNPPYGCCTFSSDILLAIVGPPKTRH